MNARRPWIRTALWIAVAALLLLVWYRTTRSVHLRPPGQAVAAPSLSWSDPQGRTGRLADLRGEVVVLNLWASWCPPCRVEIPMLARLQRELGDRGLVVVGLTAEGALAGDRLALVARELGADFDVGVPASPLTGPFAGADRLPTTWLVDRAGRVRATHVGLVSYRSLEASVRRLLAESG